MKDEIKDLLQYLKNVYESEETSTWLNKLQIKDLLDYITNLQDRIDKAIEYINKSEYVTIESYKHIHADEDGRVYNLDVLLNILQGSDE